MPADKYLTTNPEGDNLEVSFTQTSTGVANAGEGVALNEFGFIDDSLLQAVPQGNYTASENIAAGAPINIWESSPGVTKVRNANAASGLRSHGFAIGAIAIGNSGAVSTGEGTVTGLAGLTIGAQYVLGTTAGTYLEATIVNIATLTTGMVLQHLGVARSTSEIEFRLGDITVRA